MSSENQDNVRARAAAAGLALDDERLRTLAVSLEGIEATLEAVRAIPVDPVDLAMTPYDPAWPEEGRR